MRVGKHHKNCDWYENEGVKIKTSEHQQTLVNRSMGFFTKSLGGTLQHDPPNTSVMTDAENYKSGLQQQTVSYPWHSEGHAEVLASLQPEAPRRRAAEVYWVYVHSLEERKGGNYSRKSRKGFRSASSKQTSRWRSAVVSYTNTHST